MTREEHQKRHEELHVALDELAADWIDHGNTLLSQASILDLIEWSARQKENPTEGRALVTEHEVER